MRKTKLLTATALSLVLSGAVMGVFAGRAFADTTISTTVTTPYNTSTSGNITVASGGGEIQFATSTPLSVGPAITVDSNNTVDLEGAIAMSGVTSSPTNPAIGILITGGQTSGLTINGTITVTDNYTATDTTSPADGIADAPWADTNPRYGILSTGSTPFVGNVTLGSTSSIDVEGGRAPGLGSYGIRFENNITGAFSSAATITIIGDDSTGISLENGVTGTTYIGGSMSVLGQNSSAVNLAGTYGSNVVIGGSFTNTGYATTAGQTAAETAILLASTNGDDIEQAGTLMKLSGTFTDGILFEKPPTEDTTLTSTDQDGDGIADASEGTATLTQYGSAPALLIGANGGTTTIGGTVTVVGTTGAATAPTVNYGLWNRGSISASGIYAGVNATAVQIGLNPNASPLLADGVTPNPVYGTSTVTIANGIGNDGTISASALAANATALRIESGTSTPQLDVNLGTITATGTEVVTASTTTPTTYSIAPASANAIVIDTGASLPTINLNTTTSEIVATAVGSTSNATAILDKSNTLTKILNNNLISASVTATSEDGTGVDDPVTGTANAIDAHTNTVGMTITQNSITTATTTNGVTTSVTNTPEIIGNILLGTGNNTINLNAGVITGNIDFGEGAGTGASAFTISGDSTYSGTLTGSGTVALDVADGTALLDAGTKLNLSSLHVGATGVLGIQLNTATPTQAVFTSSGAAVFDSGAVVGLNLNHIILTPTSFVVLTAPSITLNGLDLTNLGGNTPYLYAVALTPNSTNTELDATFRIKTQAEGGFNNNEVAAMTPVLTAMSQDTGATTALLSQTTHSGFNSVYDQYLPDFSGENLLTLSHGAESVTQSLAALTLIPDNMAGQYWATEYGFNTNRPYGDTTGFKATGFTFAAGREQAVGGRQMVGTYLSYTSATPIDTFAIGAQNLVNSDLTVGGYWRIRDEGFKAWANAGVGYADFKDTRVVLNAYEDHTATSTWGGFSYSAGFGTSYQYRAGSFSLTPQLLGDFYGLNEAKHTEDGGTDLFDLSVEGRDSHIATGQALLNVSYDKWFVRPEMWVGYKDNLDVDIANTVAAFTAPGSTPFTLNGGNVKGGGPVVGFRFSADNEYSYFSLEGDYEDMPNYTNVSISLRTRFQF